MKRPLGKISLFALTLTALAATAEAKTLVYCSEGSPEGFNPQMFTSGTTFDASSRPVYNRLFDRERGTTTQVNALAESYEVSDDGLQYTMKLRPGVKWQTTDGFTPTRDFNADDVIFTIERMHDKNHPYNKVGGGSYEYFEGSGLSTLLDRIEKVDDMTVRFHLKNPDATFIPVMSMDFASILSAEYADAMMEAGTPEQVDLEPGRHRPVPAGQLPEGRGDPLQGQPRLLAGPAAIDNLVYRDHARRLGPLAEGQGRRMPRHGLSEPGRPRGDGGRHQRQADAAGGPERRLSRLQRREGAYGRQEGPPGAQPRHQQAGDHRRRLSGCRRRRQEPDAADAVGLQRRRRGLPLRSGGGQEAARAKPASARASRPTSGRCRCSAPTTRMRGGWPS